MNIPKALCGLFAALLVLTVGNVSAQAATVFTLIADTSGPTFSAINYPSINTAGTVAFQATLDAGGTGIFTGAGGATTPIALSSGPIFSALGQYPSINAAGTVAFQASLDAGGSGIFTGAGGPTTDIALSSGPFDSFLASPSINTAGTVAFFALLDTFDHGIFTGAGGPTTTIALASGPTFSDFGQFWMAL